MSKKESTPPPIPRSEPRWEELRDNRFSTPPLPPKKKD